MYIIFCYFMHEYPIKKVMVFGVDFRQGRALIEDIFSINCTSMCSIAQSNAVLCVLYSVIQSLLFSYRTAFFRCLLSIKSVKNSNVSLYTLPCGFYVWQGISLKTVLCIENCKWIKSFIIFPEIEKSGIKIFNA